MECGVLEVYAAGIQIFAEEVKTGALTAGRALTFCEEEK